MNKQEPNLTTCVGIRKYVKQINSTLPSYMINQILDDKEYDSVEDLNEDDTEIMCREFKVKYTKKLTKKTKEEKRVDDIFKDGPMYIQSYILDNLKRDAEAYIRRGLQREYNLLFPDIDIDISISGFDNNYEKYILEGYLIED